MIRKIQKNLTIYKAELNEKGIQYLLQARINKLIVDPISFINFKLTKPTKSFTFQGKTYKYHGDFYNYTWKNERTVELPIFWDLIKDQKKKDILEVGNVLAHYYPISHLVVDKYEKALNVINEDVVLYKPKKKFDLIISISTLEHVGWDEQPRDKEKLLLSIKNLETLLKPGGKLIFSLPVGHNPNVTRLLTQKDKLFTSYFFLKRLPSHNEWVETTYKEVFKMKYNSPLPNANAICIATIENKLPNKATSERNKMQKVKK